jgi:hypothetical protein
MVGVVRNRKRLGRTQATLLPGESNDKDTMLIMVMCLVSEAVDLFPRCVNEEDPAIAIPTFN